MVAALLRVLHSGIQDTKLLPQRGQPQISYFVRAIIRAGRFTTQFTRLDFNTRPTLGSTATITLPRKGHLLSRLYLVTTMPDIATPQLTAKAQAAAAGQTFAGPTFGWTNSLGHAILQSASVEIGGTRVEEINGRLLEVLDEFYTPLEKVSIVNDLIKRDTTGFAPGRFGRDTQTQVVTPLPFWFCCGDAGTYLPIDAIQADEVRLSITFAGLNTLYTSSAQVSTKSITSPPAGGEAYFPLAQSPFYALNPSGTPVAGLGGNPDVTTRVSRIGTVAMPTAQELSILGDTYLMAEYIYLDRPEANRFRLADVQVPAVQHYSFEPVDTAGAPQVNCYLKIPNPTRNLFFYLSRYEAPFYNAPFLATRDLSGGPAGAPTPWWPNASEVGRRVYSELVPGFAFRNSEPLAGLALIYEGKLFRYSTQAPSFYRSLLPSYEQGKSPWVNRYYYTLPFGLYSGLLEPSQHSGEANLDKIVNINLQLQLKPFAGYSDPNAVPRYFVNIFAETYNILRVFGGRGGMMFAY